MERTRVVAEVLAVEGLKLVRAGVRRQASWQFGREQGLEAPVTAEVRYLEVLEEPPALILGLGVARVVGMVRDIALIGVARDIEVDDAIVAEPQSVQSATPVLCKMSLPQRDSHIAYGALEQEAD
jgi:hypothetical protein